MIAFQIALHALDSVPNDFPNLDTIRDGLKTLVDQAEASVELAAMEDARRVAPLIRPRAAKILKFPAPGKGAPS
jgi:hypothetical protein